MEQATESSDKWSTFVSTNKTKQYLFLKQSSFIFGSIYVANTTSLV